MRDFLAEHKLMIIAVIGILLFVGFVVTQRSGTSSDSAAYKQVDIQSPMVKGSADAAISIIQYSDFICPSCSYFSTQVMPTIDKEFVETGKAKFEFRPMAFIADGSTQAGMGAYCAIDQDEFWNYHDSVYAQTFDKVFNQNLDPKRDIIFTQTDVEHIAADAGLDSTKFDDCLSSATHQADIIESTQTANSHGVNSTPYIIVNGERYTGDVTLDAFKAFLQALL